MSATPSSGRGPGAPSSPRQAIALRYDPDSEGAPGVVAKGRGEVAERILERARRHGVPVREDGDLVQLLSMCDLGEEIPPELFGAVAELLAYLYRLNAEETADTEPGGG